jgi:hypothetical protein
VKNVRFIVTNMVELHTDAAYDHYGNRGQSDNFIKNLKNAMVATGYRVQRSWPTTAGCYFTPLPAS